MKVFISAYQTTMNQALFAQSVMHFLAGNTQLTRTAFDCHYSKMNAFICLIVRIIHTLHSYRRYYFFRKDKHYQRIIGIIRPIKIRAVGKNFKNLTGALLTRRQERAAEHEQCRVDAHGEASEVVETADDGGGDAAARKYP